MKQHALRHQFVEFLPETLEEGTLYVSMQYATTAHNCACGCGNIVMTPLSPKQWKLMYDGRTITLHPSIGNWSFPCRSHYFIRQNRIEWTRSWTDEEIAASRAPRAEKRKGFRKLKWW